MLRAVSAKSFGCVGEIKLPYGFVYQSGVLLGKIGTMLMECPLAKSPCAYSNIHQIPPENFCGCNGGVNMLMVAIAIDFVPQPMLSAILRAAVSAAPTT